MNTPKQTDWTGILFVVGILALVYFFGNKAGYFVLNILARGKRLTHTTLDDAGNIPESPRVLADAATIALGRDVNVDAHSLARMITSEEPSSSQQTKVAIAWVAVNVARQRGISVTRLLTASKTASKDGKFGEQKGRWASTRNDTYEGDYAIAEAVNGGQVEDPTNGAVHYFNPSLQDRLLALGKVDKSAEEIDSSWGGDGFKVDGVNPDVTFYRNA